ncbi:GNAT family N-acetyltransferase [Streptomyces albidoflavus]|uniref:GNAT family N-acetyltransferase n=1 Tax=Streptomyces koyangensis TaxID=188770 RepID=A0ABX7EA40_9ACTN|nr:MULTISPECIES: GNAT family N-acetyltransferase [Streptomyces]KLJ04412.1 acetyltransferase [Streptomyces sp. KE1]QRF01303.1 GNAT family N-acetyltransferase [Streptomyces koyangensis]RZE91143.1 N-acetyltransferase [Streptomyces sp. SCA2-2]
MGMSVIVAAAQESDAEQIFRLQYLCFQSEAERYGNYRIEALVEPLDSVRASVGRDCVFVARLGDEVVGAVTGTVGEDGTARIGKLCVHPRLQRHGLGARLLLAVERALTTERGASLLRLHTGHRSDLNLRLYRRAGYAAVGDTTVDGVQQIVLEKAAPTGQEYAASA